MSELSIYGLERRFLSLAELISNHQLNQMTTKKEHNHERDVYQ